LRAGEPAQTLRTERASSYPVLPREKRHPREMGAPEITAFLSHLTVDGHVAALTQNQAHADVSTTMLYTHVLGRGGLGVRSPADGL